MDRAEFRQRALISCMQGLLANPKLIDPVRGDIAYADIAKLAVKFADALLEANTTDEMQST